MQGIRVKNSEGTVNARVEELNAMLAGIEVSEKPTCLDGLAFAFRTAGKAYHGKLIQKGMEALPIVLMNSLNIELRELLKEVKDGRPEHIN